MLARITYPLARLLDRMHARLARSRPASVLVLVVVLLVLLALIGTAFISTARVDRASAQQNAYNTQIDLLLQGVINMAEAVIAQDSGNIDYFSSPNSTFLANRLPSGAAASPQPGMFPDASLPTEQAVWWFMSGPLSGSMFESPYVNPLVNRATYPLYPRYLSRGASPSASPSGAPMQLVPTFVTINSASGTNEYPAFYDPVTKQNFLAASASGDGVADSGLFRLPIGEMNGVTWYAAVRIIDNGSANNASIAWQPNTDYTQNLFGNFFPTNIDLTDTLPNGPREVNNLVLNYRFAGVNQYQTPYDDSLSPGSPRQRTDFSFISPYDAMWCQLGRRLDNPDWVNGSARYQALPISESMAMAYRFCLINPSASPSLLEQLLPSSTYNLNYSSTRPYSPDQVNSTTGPGPWYMSNFAFELENPIAPVLPRRAILVSHNPVNTMVPNVPNVPPKFNARGPWSPKTTYSMGDWVSFNSGPPTGSHAYVCLTSTPTGGVAPPNNPDFWALMPWANVPVKTCINTASFGPLYASFWAAMYDRTTPTGLPLGITNDPVNSRMFRSPVRTGTVSILPAQMIQLRAALAAINAINLRDSGVDVISKQIQLTAFDSAKNQQVPVSVMLFGNRPQPYITEVYANNKSDSSTPGYIAIELHNPYSDRVFTLTNWQLATINRVGNGPLTVNSLMPTGWTGMTPVIPANGYIVLASSATPPKSAIKPPVATVGGKTGGLYVVPQLLQAFNQELLIVRPRRWDGQLSRSNVFGNVYAENLGPQEMVPVDSFDFTNLTPPMPNDQNPMVWRYRRPSTMTTDNTSKQWHFVYPGPYVVAAAAGGGGGGGVVSTTPRLVGTIAVPEQTAEADQKPGGLSDLSSLGAADPLQYNPGPATANTINSVYVDFPIQIANTDFAGPLKINLPTQNSFPFGQFARDGDILQTPFIGAYRVSGAGNALIEINSVSMDSSRADDQDPTDDAAENIGRFCPILPQDLIDRGVTASTANDYLYNLNAAQAAAAWRYHWAMDLFDYLTTQSPPDDYFPNVDPNRFAHPVNASSPPSVQAYSYYHGGTYSPIGNVYGVANVDKKVVNWGNTQVNANGATEELAPINGLIDINTAPWPVLATLPFVDAVMVNGMTAAKARQYNTSIAQAIVYYRDVDDGTVPNSKHPHGAFHSLFELNSVPGFRTAGGLTAQAPALFPQPINPPQHYDDPQGDISPQRAGVTDNVWFDFESQNLMLNRISNLVSLRTDSFTVYVLVQGWRNVGTSAPDLVAQRRAALIIDRSAYNNLTKKLSVTNVPVE